MGRILVVLFSVVFVFVGFETFRFLSAGPGSGAQDIIFSVPSGQSFKAVAEDLQAKGLISDAFKMRVFAKLLGRGSHVKRGEYALNNAMSPQQILSILVAGKSIQYPITFPEGYNIYEMAALAESRGFYKAEEFVKACRNKELIEQLLGVDVSSLEGYLFPETYKLTKFTPLRELLAAMVQNFKAAYAEVERGGLTAPVNLSRHELVTLASVVEKETGASEERPQIASVFYNRLKKNMRLQSDPTILYGIWIETGSYKNNITREDIAHATRYNTYTVPRLPFGPIANPGRETLAAVFRPAKTDFLYFVSRNDGTHIFTRTYEDHIKAVKAFQLNPAARRGKSWRDLNK